MSLRAFFMVILLAGCASAPAYKQIQQDNSEYNAHVFEATHERLSNALAQTLLAKKFQIDTMNDPAGGIMATCYLSQPKRNVAIVLQARIFPVDAKHQKLYLTAVETTQRNYVVDHTRFLLWVVPLPGGGGKEVSKSKEEQRVITDPSFYASLFDALKTNLS